MPLAPEMSEVLEEWLRSELAEVHTAIPGKVKTYDPETQTAEVIVQVRASTPREDGSRQPEEAPVIPNVPVAWLRAGGYSLHLPLAANDAVLLIFNEAAIAHWRETGQLSDPGDLTRHSLSYPYAIPCDARNAGKLTDTPADAAVFGLPSGGHLRIGAESGSEFVALAEKVTAQLNALKDAIANAVPIAQDGGIGLQNTIMAALADWPGDIASTALKAKG
jgi:hypothetical protein